MLMYRRIVKGFWSAVVRRDSSFMMNGFNFAALTYTGGVRASGQNDAVKRQPLH